MEEVVPKKLGWRIIKKEIRKILRRVSANTAKSILFLSYPT